MVILDTNVVSEVLKAQASARVVEWMARQPAGSLHLTTISQAELLYGVARLPEGRRHRELARVVQGAIDDFEGRVLSFDRPAAARYAVLAAERKARGQSVHTADVQIAAIASVHAATLATRNLTDFAGNGVAIVNPFE